MNAERCAACCVYQMEFTCYNCPENLSSEETNDNHINTDHCDDCAKKQ